MITGPEIAKRAAVVAVAQSDFTVAGILDALLEIRGGQRRLTGLYAVAVEVVQHFGSGRRLLRDELQQFLSASDAFRKAFARSGAAVPIGAPAMQPVAGLHVSDQLPALTTLAALRDWLALYDDELAAYTSTYRGGLDRSGTRWRHYHYQWYARRGSPPRLIEAPKQRLKDLQVRIASGMLRHVPAHDAAHGFVRGRSVLTGVQQHVGQRCVLRMDLEDCFASVARGRVLRVFLNVGYPEDVAVVLARLCTTATPTAQLQCLATPGTERSARLLGKLRALHLPQGAPTSPALMNLALYRIDARLRGLAARFGATYSRYADDLLFSGDDAFRRDAHRCADYAAAILLAERLHVAHHKTRIMCRSQAQRSCGLVLNERAALPRRERQRLEAILHNCVQHGPSTQNRSEVPDFRAHLQGCVAHAKRFDLSGKLASLLARIDWQR